MIKELYIHTGRQTVLPDLTISLKKATAVLAEVLLITCFLPTFFSCNKTNFTDNGNTRDSSDLKLKMELAVTKPKTCESLDIFIFEDDRMRRLDTYRRAVGTTSTSVSSRRGKKIMAVIANTDVDDAQLRDIRTYGDLTKLYTDLKNDDPESPVMYGEQKIDAGQDSRCELELKAFMAEIRINSLCCDFHARPYAGEKLKNVRIYLTNICSKVPFAGEPPETPTGILNYGYLHAEDTCGFAASGLISRKLAAPAGESVLSPDIRLYCYGNTAETEKIGSPFTRLVIEGELLGKTVYYPIDINRGLGCDGTPGITGNCSYIYDITVTRRGVSDPDTPILTDMFTNTLKVLPWKEQERRTIIF